MDERRRVAPKEEAEKGKEANDEKEVEVGATDKEEDAAEEAEEEDEDEKARRSVSSTANERADGTGRSSFQWPHREQRPSNERPGDEKDWYEEDEEEAEEEREEGESLSRSPSSDSSSRAIVSFRIS